VTQDRRAGWAAPIVMAPPRPGDFCCVPVSGPAGLAITIGQWIDGSPFRFYDHAEIYIGKADAAGPYGYTVSAYPDGNGKRALPCAAARLPGSLWSSGLVDLTGVQRTGIVALAAQRTRVRYSWLDYAALGLHALHVPAPGLRDYIESTRHEICSQFVDTCYTACDAHLFQDERWSGYVTPGMLAKLLQSLIVDKTGSL
jgi:hypothetical protein